MGRARAGASFGARLGADKACGRATQRVDNDAWRRKSPRPVGLSLQWGAGVVANARDTFRYHCALRLACTPLQAQRGPDPKPDSLLALGAALAQRDGEVVGPEQRQPLGKRPGGGGGGGQPGAQVGLHLGAQGGLGGVGAQPAGVGLAGRGVRMGQGLGWGLDSTPRRTRALAGARQRSANRPRWLLHQLRQHRPLPTGARCCARSA